MNELHIILTEKWPSVVGCLRRDCIGFDSSADLGCGCTAQVRRGRLLLLHKLKQSVSSNVLQSCLQLCSVQRLSN